MADTFTFAFVCINPQFNFEINGALKKSMASISIFSHFLTFAIWNSVSMYATEGQALNQSLDCQLSEKQTINNAH